jgi:hypothetical protein
MLHTIEQLIERINLMHDKAAELHRVRNAKPNYDKSACDNILDDIQAIAYLISRDKWDDKIKTEIDPRN